MKLLLERVGRAMLPYAIGAIAMLFIFWTPYNKLRHDLRQEVDSVSFYKGKAGALALELASLKEEKAKIETSYLRQLVEQEARYEAIRNRADLMSQPHQQYEVKRILKLPVYEYEPLPTYIKAPLSKKQVSYQLRQDTICYDAAVHTKLTGALLELEQRRSDADTAALAYAQLRQQYQAFYVDVGEVADARGVFKRRGPKLRKLLRQTAFP